VYFVVQNVVSLFLSNYLNALIHSFAHPKFIHYIVTEKTKYMFLASSKCILKELDVNLCEITTSDPINIVFLTKL